MQHPFVKLPGENITKEVMNVPAQGKCSPNDGSSCTGIAPLWSCAHNTPQSAAMEPTKQKTHLEALPQIQRA